MNKYKKKYCHSQLFFITEIQHSFFFCISFLKLFPLVNAFKTLSTFPHMSFEIPKAAMILFKLLSPTYSPFYHQNALSLCLVFRFVVHTHI